MNLSPNTQAILLLTAPLLFGRGSPRSEILSLGEYNQLARLLREQKRTPEDLLGADRPTILEACRGTLDASRLQTLLERGLLLSQVLERWNSRGLWVISRADRPYPARFKERLKDACPPVLYGCGNPQLLGRGGGLAVVGSRNVDERILSYTNDVGALAARAGQLIVSGGARGVDQAAMVGALERGGQVVGVLADSLERSALQASYRAGLSDGRLALVSPFDPAAGFQVGNAMQRNKFIYALADAALVVNSDYQKGGTWAGASEQLDKFRFCPVFVRAGLEKGLTGLIEKGARTWPEPQSAEELLKALSGPSPSYGENQQQFDFVVREKPPSPKEQLLATVTELLGRYAGEMDPESVGDYLGVAPEQARSWLIVTGHCPDES